MLSGEATVNGAKQEVNAAFLNVWRAQTLRAYQDSELFTLASTDPSDTDLRAEVKVLDRGEGSLAMAFLTGLTLYLIPSSATDELTVTTAVKDRSGATLGTFERSEAVTMWQQLFLVFAMPFNFPGSVVKETLYDLNRATIADARDRGVF